MGLHVREKMLLLAQTDSLDGEGAGSAIGALYDAGSKNVQVIPTITKKNRPGMLFVVDVDESVLDAVEGVLVRDVGVTGWHRVPTEHAYVDVSVETLEVVVRSGDGGFTMEVARKCSSADPELVRPEYESCAELRRRLAEECGVQVSLALARQRICKAFLSGNERPVIRF